MRNETIRYGIALGGGGVRGYAHLGVMQALKEEGVTASAISGVSSGAIAGVFLASGREPRDVFELMKRHGLSSYTKLNVPRMGLLSLDNLRRALQKELKARHFEDLEMPFIVAASDMYKGEIRYFSSGSLIRVIQASASIPVLFAPVKIDGTYYVDGGLFDNVAVKPLKEHCDRTIGVSVTPVREIDSLNNLIQVAIRTFQLSVNTSTEKARKLADIFIEPEGLKRYHMLETKGADHMFSLGYNEAKKVIKDENDTQ